MKYGLQASIGSALLASALLAPQERRVHDESRDVASVRALGEAYTSAWLADDPDGVLDVFADDAVLVPHLGNPQAEGKQAIRAHFWPPEAPATAVESFTRTSKEVVVEGRLAYDRGTFELAFTMEDAPDAFTSKGNYVAVARKDDEGRWRWVLYTWNHP